MGKESPGDCICLSLSPSSKLGRTNILVCGEANLPFPRWMLPTSLLKLVTRTILNQVLGDIGDTLILGASQPLPDGQDFKRVNLDRENYFGILRARMLLAEANL